MEATGVYHESLAYYLEQEQCLISIILPNKISSYFKTLDVKTVTDKTSSGAIALFGLERALEQWHSPDPLYKKLRQLTRERDQLVQERTMIKNQFKIQSYNCSKINLVLNKESQKSETPLLIRVPDGVM